ncbi:MAG TPA: hypothetical protein VE978_22775 [Chitinophagales bacterium]|nr:hypothetical protein [Chitinophagales bacterium]
MESFRPYVWLRKQSNQYNLFYSISIPSGFRVSGGLQSPVDDTTNGIRTYQFTIEANMPSSPSTVDNSVGNHSQPLGISKIAFQVIDDSDSERPIKKGETDTGYQSADDMM